MSLGKKVRDALFGVPKLPEALTSILGGEPIVHQSPGIFVRLAGTWQSPGRSAAAEHQTVDGAFAITATRVVAAVHKECVLEARLADAAGEPAGTVRLAPDGLHVTIQVAAAIPKGSGTIELHFKDDVPPAALQGMPPSGMGVPAGAMRLGPVLGPRAYKG